MANPYDIEAMRAFGLASSNPYDQSYTQYVQDNYTPEELAQAQAALAASRGEAPPVAPVAPEEDVYDVSGLGIEEAAPGDSLPAVQALGADLLQEEQAAPAPQGRISRGQKRSDSVGVSRATPTVVKKRMGPLDVDKAVIDAAATERSQPILAAEKERVKAIRAQEDAEIALAEQEREAKKRAAEFAIEEAKAEAVMDAAAHQEAQQRIDQITERVEAVRSMKVDPQRFWTSGGTMHNAAGVLAAAVGGFLQPVLGQNTIQPLLNRFVEQDIDAQKEEIKGARENVSDLRALHALGLQQDEIASGNRAEQRLMRKAGLLGQLEAEVAKYRDPVTRAKADKLVADLQTDFAKEIDTIYEQERTRAFDEMKTKRQLQLQSQQVATSRYSAKTARMGEERAAEELRLRKEAAKAAADEALESSYIPISTGITDKDGNPISIKGRLYASSDKRLGELFEQTQQLQNTATALDGLSLLARDRVMVPGSEDFARFKSRAMSVIGDLGGQISDKDAERILSKYGLNNAEGILKLESADTIRAVLDDAKAEVVSQGQNLANNLGTDARFGVYDKATKQYLAELEAGGGSAPEQPTQTTDEYLAMLESPDLSAAEKGATFDSLFEAAAENKGDDPLIITPAFGSGRPGERNQNQRLIDAYIALPDSEKTPKRSRALKDLVQAGSAAVQETEANKRTYEEWAKNVNPYGVLR